MLFVKLFVILLTAVRMAFCRQLFRACIGRCRISGKTAAGAFIVLWVFESFITGISPVGREMMLMELFFFAAELLFMTIVSFCYQGTWAQRLMTAVSLPLLYWGFKWSMECILSGQMEDGRGQVLTAVCALVLFGAAGIFLGRAGNSRREMEQEMLEREIRMYENEFRVIRQSQNNVRALKHDMKHHIKMLADLVAGEGRQEALEYLSAMGAFMENREEYVTSGNERIDSILNDMISRAESAGVKTDWEVRIPEGLEIATFDIHVILSNLFENAMNAMENMTEPSFSVRMHYDRGVLCIRMENSCEEGERICDAREGHGYGLKNVRRIAEKYHGSAEVTKQGGVFCVCVLLLL